MSGEESYHITKKGDPAVCRARKKPCPLGDSDDHYPDKETALRAIEKKFKEETLPRSSSASGGKTGETQRASNWAGYSDEELADLEEDSVKNHLESGVPLTDDEYERRREYIRRVRSMPSTHKENTVRVKGKTVYTEERRAQHEEILADFEERFKKVPNKHKVVMTGGMPGSGKTTLLETVYGTNVREEYAVLNPDDVKVEMARRGMTPEVRGLTPLETDDLIMYEAGVIHKELYDRLSEEGKNLVVDRTMLRAETVKKDIKQLRERGYDSVEVIFADVSPETAYQRIGDRHRAGVDEYFASGGKTLGERVVPGRAVAVSRVSDDSFRSANAKTLVELYEAGEFVNPPRVFDTTDGVKEKSVESLRLQD